MTAVILIARARSFGGRRHPTAASRPHLLFDAGEEIYAQGEAADWLYRVEFGAVRLYCLLADGRRQISSFHLPGEVFGFEAGRTHSYYADATAATGLCAIPRPHGSDVTTEVMDAALRCLARAQQHLLVVGRQNAIERIAAFLLAMAQRQGGTSRFDLPMSRTDIADHLGLTVETVSRMFSRLRAEGLIKLIDVRTIEIAKPAALYALCE